MTKWKILFILAVIIATASLTTLAYSIFDRLGIVLVLMALSSGLFLAVIIFSIKDWIKTKEE